MKKLMLLTIMITITMILSFDEVRAQAGTCLPDCENSAWSAPDYLYIYFPQCDEYITIVWRYRFACSTWYDYYIESVRFNSSSCLEDVYNNDLNLMLQDISELLILNNPANFPPIGPNECEDNWRVIKGSCWTPDHITGIPSIENKKKSKGDIIQGPSVDIIYPCTSNDCCLEFFQVCNDSEGNRTITQTGYLPPEDPTCEGTTNENCVPVCGSVYNR